MIKNTIIRPVNRVDRGFFSAGIPIKNPSPSGLGFRVKTLAMTYSCMTESHYHRRGCVSLPCSGWERVVPQRYDHQGEGGGSHRDRLDPWRTRSHWVKQIGYGRS